MPFDPDTVAAAWGTIAGAGLAWHLTKVADWRDRVAPSARALADAGGRHTASDLLDALAAAAQVRVAAAALFSRYDLLLWPATAALAWAAAEVFPTEIDGQPVGPRGHAAFTGWMNVAGLPSVTVPVAMTADAGGIGLQFVASNGRDRDLLAMLRSSPVLAGFSPAPLAPLDPISAQPTEASQ